MTPNETTAILRKFNEWRRTPGDGWREHPTSKEITAAIDAAVEMIDRSVKLEQALQAMTKGYKSVSYAQWPPEMHFAAEVLEETK